MADIVPHRHQQSAAAAEKPFKFKARPFSKRVMSSVGDLGVPVVRKRPATKVKEFSLSSSRPSSARPKNEPEKKQTTSKPKPAIRKAPAPSRRLSASGSPKWSCRRGSGVPARPSPQQ
jgi:hypothetical protein